MTAEDARELQREQLESNFLTREAIEIEIQEAILNNCFHIRVDKNRLSESLKLELITDGFNVDNDPVYPLSQIRISW